MNPQYNHAGVSRKFQPDNKSLTLLQVVPGRDVEVLSLDGLTPSIRATLQAYGLGPGKRIRVLQHNPETVIEIEATEFAFEKEVASSILVQLLS
jgi:Fe2+ transport system protein FeoA